VNKTALLAVFIFAGAPAARSADSARRGSAGRAAHADFLVSRPIGGDNRNAVATIVPPQGEAAWRPGLDLLRCSEETFCAALRHTAPNMFAGSLFDLEKDDVRIRLTLKDPDGVGADNVSRVEKLLTARTRAEPRPAAGGRVYHVYPPGYTGEKLQPAFAGLLEAYYIAALGGDWSRASPPRAKAGDTLLVHAGLYLSKHDHYSHEINSRFTTCCSTPWDGTYYLTQDGTADKPIAIVAAGDGEVIFDGDGNTVLFNLMGGDYQYFEGITFRNTGTAIEAGQKAIAGSKGLTVKRSRFVDVGTAVIPTGRDPRVHIADNDLLGREA
jgi:hypothetical protein